MTAKTFGRKLYERLTFREQLQTLTLAFFEKNRDYATPAIEAALAGGFTSDNDLIAAADRASRLMGGEPIQETMAAPVFGWIPDPPTPTQEQPPIRETEQPEGSIFGWIPK